MSQGHLGGPRMIISNGLKEATLNSVFSILIRPRWSGTRKRVCFNFWIGSSCGAVLRWGQVRQGGMQVRFRTLREMMEIRIR